MKTQRFNSGNLVEVLDDHFLLADRGDRRAVIEYSYTEKYGGDSSDQYSVRFLSTGQSVAWVTPSQMKFIDKGGEHLIKQALQTKEVFDAESRDLSKITEKLKAGEDLNTIGIQVLFDLLGFRSSFYSTGEFYQLLYDWATLKPVFMYIALMPDLEEVRTTLGSDYSEYDIDSVFFALHPELQGEDLQGK